MSRLYGWPPCKGVMYSLPAAHIANPSFSWHKLGLATCRGIVVKPNKFATFWGIGNFLDFFFSSRSRISCIQMRMQQQDCWRFPSLVAEQLLALFQDLAGPQAFHLQTNQLAQGRSLFWRGYLRTTACFRFKPNSARSVSFSTSSLSHWSPASGEIRTLIFVKAL